mmetsp:Transcript_50143/g.79866  ORF Transcript_50143/g.79866 Transcript_50143/m.79866 type:complete len:407 (-) Transcript_50143:244-1464(-)|eukprot:CAMPEP_0197035338 /NCGR_PEP_ID=MMETSP1384-20130603/13168_1 /TAXON_ID=29189 /ORGANISM="Ammonia sp." /LENGTH=406 /DNA_ID=CAMNT_0042465389 /DNA_START=47 /DNA_END=1267 /DNA_ORIENTATION=+
MFAISSFVALYIGQAYSAKWDYDRPGHNTSHWDHLYEECGYPRQSPIDVQIDLTGGCRQPLELDWTSQTTHFAIRNNGHSLQAIPMTISHNGGSDISGLEVLHHRNDTGIRLKNKFFDTYNSNVNKEYCFDSLHFHWGRTDDQGSEHTINGKAYPLEVHLVHYSCDYRMASAALKDYASGAAAQKYDDDNVLAVIGIMFEIGDANPVLGQMLDDIIMEGIFAHKDDEFAHYIEMYYTEFDIRRLLPESREMVAYMGSLTTPPCYQTVRWHLMKEPLTVSEEQMKKFRLLLESTSLNDSMAPNFRPVQPRNGRKIWQCQEDVDEDDASIAAAQTMIIQQQAEGTWKYIAISFVVLFSITFITCFGVIWYLKQNYGKITMEKRAPKFDAVSSTRDVDIESKGRQDFAE